MVTSSTLAAFVDFAASALAAAHAASTPA
jgi:hypothetical protein